MAYDDLLSAAQRRTRTGRSFFPAANYSPLTTANQGVRIGYQAGGAGATVAPEDNPAYQAAISRPRAGSGSYTWITTPSGGSMRVPTASVGNLLKPGTSLSGSQVTQIGNQLPIDRAAAYAKGYGAPAPAIVGVGTPGQAYQKSGGVYNPIENLTPQERIAGGVGSTLDYLRSNPALTAATNALSGFGQNIARWFGGGAPSAFGGTSAAGAPPSPTPIPSSTPIPTATPFKTADGRSDLLRDTEGTFYGGGQVPIPTPTPTPGTNRYAQYQPRRYSDLGYY